MPYITKKQLRKILKEEIKKYHDLIVNLGTERMRKKDAVFPEY